MGGLKAGTRTALTQLALAATLDQLIDAQLRVHLLVQPVAGGGATVTADLQEIQRQFGIRRLTSSFQVTGRRIDHRCRHPQFAAMLTPERFDFGE